MLLAATLVSAGSGAALMGTDDGRVELVDEWERTATAFGQEVDDAAYARLGELSERGAVGYAVVGALLAGPVLAFAVAAAVRLTFRGATFTQALAVTSHASIILALRRVIAAPVAYARESTASATSLGVWFPGFDETSPVARFLGALDVFVMWWAVVLAIGVAVLYQRRARTLAATFVGMYAALALLLAIVMAVTGAGN